MKLFSMILSSMLLNPGLSDIISVGGQRDPHNCLTSAGYTWCQSSNECIRQWETPCSDNYDDCPDCLNRQRLGENIACPAICDTISNDPCSLGCPPPMPCPAPPSPNCEYIPPSSDKCGCAMGCGTINCSHEPIISQEGESCGGFTMTPRICIDELECVYTMGPYIADAPGTCHKACPTSRDQWGNCIDKFCSSWYDGCNTCSIDKNQISSCTEMMCYESTNNPSCLEYSIPDNCATWYDGCNTCSVENGQPSSCTYMMCFVNNKPDCLSYYRSGH
jgi:hypothetical protein